MFERMRQSVLLIVASRLAFETIPEFSLEEIEYNQLASAESFLHNLLSHRVATPKLAKDFVAVEVKIQWSPAVVRSLAMAIHVWALYVSCLAPMKNQALTVLK
jgi:hypothetical protein